MFGSLLRASVGLVVETPVSLVADFVTLGGSLTDEEQPYTATALEKIMKNVKEATE